MYNLHFTLCSVLCAAYSLKYTLVRALLLGVHCSLYSAQYAVCSVQCAVYSMLCAVYSVQCTVYSVQCTVNSVQCTVYIAQHSLDVFLAQTPGLECLVRQS